MSWFKSLRLATQLYLTFVAVALISVIVGAFGIHGARSLHQLMVDTYKNSTMGVIYSGSANQSLINCQRALGNCILAPDAEAKKTQQAHMMEYRAAVTGWATKERSGTAEDQEEQAQWRLFDQQWTPYVESTRKVVDLMNEGKRPEAERWLALETRPKFGELEKTLGTLVELNQKGAEESNKAAELASGRVQTMIISVIVAGLEE